MAAAALMLAWLQHEHIVGAMTAVGLRGEYLLERESGGWRLRALGHDGLPMPVIPPGGRWFGSLDSARTFANEADRRCFEPQVSGV